MRTLSFNQYREKYMLTFYKRLNKKKILYKDEECGKFEAFATLYARHAKGNSEKEIELVLSGMSADFSIANK